MSYPFEFDELRLTYRMLDVLGFTEYWAGGSDDYGERTFGISGVKIYWLGCISESEDPCSGYCKEPVYQAEKFRTAFKYGKDKNIYFLHDLYDDIKENAPEVLEIFIEKTRENGVNMYSYIESYLEWKTKNTKNY